MTMKMWNTYRFLESATFMSNDNYFDNEIKFQFFVNFTFFSFALQRNYFIQVPAVFHQL